MAAVCRELDKRDQKSRVQQALKGIVSQDARDFATRFVALQDSRQAADYDAAEVFLISTVLDKLQDAEDAFAAFDRIPPDEQADILALMMVKARS